MATLITGGAGFLGSHLCERLLEQDHEVLCMDNFFTGRRRNVSHLLENPNFELIRHDVVDPLKAEVDRIYNLACPASPVHYQYNPIKTVKTSVMGGDQLSGVSQKSRGSNFTGFYFRGLWGSRSTPSTRELPRECEPNRVACLL